MPHSLDHCPQSCAVMPDMFQVSPSTLLVPTWKSSRAEGRTSCIGLSAASWIKAPGKQQISLGEGSGWQMRFSVPCSRDLLTTITCSFLLLLHSSCSASTSASLSNLFSSYEHSEASKFLRSVCAIGWVY